MKNQKLIAIFLGIAFLFSSATQAAKTKKVDSTQHKDVEVDFRQFGKYLFDGNPDSIEGIYRTRDKRYTIALIKNETNEHDFIGVVINADNKYWHRGEVKFNFVRNDKLKLQGYYYDSLGKAYPITFKIGKSSIKSKLLKKVSLSELQEASYAYLN